jgi:hypothetical protein
MALARVRKLQSFYHPTPLSHGYYCCWYCDDTWIGRDTSSRATQAQRVVLTMCQLAMPCMAWFVGRPDLLHGHG